MSAQRRTELGWALSIAAASETVKTVFSIRTIGARPLFVAVFATVLLPTDHLGVATMATTFCISGLSSSFQACGTSSEGVTSGVKENNPNGLLLHGGSGNGFLGIKIATFIEPLKVAMTYSCQGDGLVFYHHGCKFYVPDQGAYWRLVVAHHMHGVLTGVKCHDAV